MNENWPRHETSVAAGTIEIVYQDDDMVVIDKPCSIPVRNNPHSPAAKLLCTPIIS